MGPRRRDAELRAYEDQMLDLLGEHDGQASCATLATPPQPSVNGIDAAIAVTEVMRVRLV
jgi:hypothetical protein